MTGHSSKIGASEEGGIINYPDNSVRVLDKGFVRLVDCMGDDAAIVQSARVSYGKGTKSVNEDEGLIRYLLRHRHTTPFEMVEFKFHVRLPIFVARQWIRHRTANVNEMSGRYSEMPDCFYEPEHDLCTTQSAQNKQGGTGFLVENAAQCADEMSKSNQLLYAQYQSFIARNMRRELARISLPLSLYTEWYWKIDLHNLLHFLELRLDSHAQYEIRVYAEAIANIVKEKVPMTWRAFEDYRLKSMTISGPEVELLSEIIKGNIVDFSAVIPNNRERTEFCDKLTKLGYTERKI